MNLIDLTIIYLACGSPFGVYQITKRQPEQSRIDWVRIVLSFVVWPAYAATLLLGRFFRDAERAEAMRLRQIDVIRLEIERIAFSGESMPFLFEFREIFYRFTGLSEASNTLSNGRSTNEIFEISGHGNKSLASKCLARRNTERLAFHVVMARNEFVDLLFRLTDATTNRNEVVALALELAEYLQDRDVAFDLAAMLSVEPELRQAPKSDLEKEVWKSRTPTISATN